MMLFLISLLAVASSFYFIAQNMLERNPDREVFYNNFIYSLLYVYFCAIGDYAKEDFLGSGDEGFLWTYLVATNLIV